MKKQIVIAVAALFAAGAWAAGPEEAMNKAGCLACHAKDKKMVGPSFQDIAAKYKDNKGAADVLATKIIKGGAGVWGPVPMPANTQVSEADAKKLAAWVLSTK